MRHDSCKGCRHHKKWISEEPCLTCVQTYISGGPKRCKYRAKRHIHWYQITAIICYLAFFTNVIFWFINGDLANIGWAIIALVLILIL